MLGEIFMFNELILKRESCRNYNGEPVSTDLLLECVDAARLSPSACNSQPWKYYIVNGGENAEKIRNNKICITCRYETFGFNIDDSENARLNYFGIYDNSVGTEFKIKTVNINSAKYLTPEAFASYYTLEQVSIEGTLTEIPYSAFIYCINLNYVNMSDSITKIGNNAFNYCESLENVSIQSNIDKIPDRAFGSSANLKSIILPDSIINVLYVSFTAFS